MKLHFSFSFFDGFVIFLRNFDEILPEFHGNVQEMINCLEILTKSARKIRKMPEIISGISEKFHILFHFFTRLPRKQKRGTRKSPALQEGEPAGAQSLLGHEDPPGARGGRRQQLKKNLTPS